MKASRVSRIIQILTALQSGQCYAVDDLTKMLGIGRRTVFRDLKDIQKADIPCYFDKNARGYTIDPSFFLAAPELNSQETLGLLLLVHKAGCHINIPFKDSILRAALKIENNLPGAIKRFCVNALKNISMKTDPHSEIDLFDKVFVELIQAILNKTVLTIHYYRPEEQKCIRTNLNPYHLLCDEHEWHIIGKSSLAGGVRTFKLSRIQKLEATGQCFFEDEGFDINEYLGRAWAVMPEGRLYNIKLRFAPKIARDVASVRWHSTQTVTFEDDGSAVIEFRVDGLNEIIWWILSYGDKVQVLAPRELRKRIIQIAENAIRRNKQYLKVSS